MNNERFEIIIKDLENDTTVLKEKTNTIMGAINKGKENTLEQMADRLTDSVLNKLLGGENE